MVKIKQGEILKLNLDPTKGHEQAGYRPVLVVSNNDFNRLCGGLVEVVPITSEIKQFPLNINLPKNAAVHGQALLSQLRTIDLNSRKFKRAGKVTDEFLQQIVKILIFTLK